MKRRTRKELAAILILILLCGCTRTNPAAEAEATNASVDMNLAESQETAETQALDFPDVSQEEKNVQAEETAVQTEAESTAAAA